MRLFLLLFVISAAPARAESQFCTKERQHCKDWYRKMLEAYVKMGDDGYQQMRNRYHGDTADTICDREAPDQRPDPEACEMIQAGFRGKLLSPEEGAAICPVKYIEKSKCPESEEKLPGELEKVFREVKTRHEPGKP